MSGASAVMRALLALLLTLAGVAAAQAADADTARLLFTGDIMLSRQVAREIAARGGLSPWHGLRDVLRSADLVVGNFEGTVGGADACDAPKELCFAVDPHLVPLLKDAGFTALGIANNHSSDLGAAGRKATREALQAAGLGAIGSAESPAFAKVGGRTLALISLNLVAGRDGQIDRVPSWQVAQQLRLARALGDWVIVSVHWGKELADWVVPEQEAAAKWLVAQGADLIIGAHPHVVQPPACVDGKPVFYSLGNHVFDQKYPQTKRGLIADCEIKGDRLTCGGLPTRTPDGSAYPAWAAAQDQPPATLAQCPVKANAPLRVAGQAIGPWIRDGEIASDRLVLEGRGEANRWRTPPRALLSAEAGRLVADQPPLLFTLERHASPIDGEDGPRPYVYEVTAHGLVAKWRGSALAWPLLDAVLIADDAGQSYLCALHRGDSFIMLDTAKPSATRTQVYAWNGFGFTGVNDDALAARCAGRFDLGG
ncbi:CapA family protein [Bradyrhizobium sp. SRS-191]|uniref:CapA family protein n=1 Tax=Bradyrhizobium sp. SRS-191 TaxID=2962606 RepID=UPI00211E32A9|nr:CapA family protein [Bradyrhizobium sp. SRS-191]